MRKSVFRNLRFLSPIGEISLGLGVGLAPFPTKNFLAEKNSSRFRDGSDLYSCNHARYVRGGNLKMALSRSDRQMTLLRRWEE
jgi:hypothetical protein